VVVSNDFGSVTSAPTLLQVNTTFTVDLNATVALDMIWCPPGTFTMGSPTSEAGRSSIETERQVTLTNGFFLGKYEVTQAQYHTIMNGNPAGLNPDPSHFKGSNRPVEKVSWDDAQIFLAQLNAIEQTMGRLPAGWKYVLPTEAQWEYACRAGTTTAYSWGNDVNSSLANYNWDGNDLKQTVEVGQFSANYWGFYDMHGNVWELVYDNFQYYPVGIQINPEGPALPSKRVHRGGSWQYPGHLLRSATRSAAFAYGRSLSRGFRIALQNIQPDTVNPEIQLFEVSTINHSEVMPYVDPRVEAHDVRDGNITSSITVSGTVDMNTTGTYILTYSVADAAGNTATANRTVTVGNRSVDLNATVAMDMLWVPPGTFTMGSPTTEVGRHYNETEHNVSLTQGFYLGKYEVTQAQYQAVMTGNTDSLSATPSQWPNNPNRPVEKVSWADAQIFLTRLNAQQSANIPSGWAYVLPSESQWEYACRASTSTMYSWGNDINASRAKYNVNGVAQSHRTLDVGNYAANPWGFFDMHGNVWEWTADWFGVLITGDPLIDPLGPASGSSRVRRGGSWGISAADLRSAYRTSLLPSTRHGSIGFRVGFQKQ
jgi:formylglycine-generating enzyme required for sulfatase activity